MQEHVAAIARPCAMVSPLPTTNLDRLKNTLDWASWDIVALSHLPKRLMPRMGADTELLEGSLGRNIRDGITLAHAAALAGVTASHEPRCAVRLGISTVLNCGHLRAISNCAQY